jgi:excisionase family DNA binding protein
MTRKIGVGEVARLLKVSVPTVWAMVQRGELPEPEFHFGKRIKQWDAEQIKGLVAGEQKAEAPVDPAQAILAMFGKALEQVLADFRKKHGLGEATEGK